MRNQHITPVLILVIFIVGIAVSHAMDFPAGLIEEQVHGDKGSVSPTIEDHIFGQRIELHSSHLGENKTVFIHLPHDYKDGTKRYPVMYVLDGGDYFEPFAGMVKYMSSFEMTPEMIVVAVAHGDRLKEFTFTPANEETGNWPTSGGAESFREFLEKELLPHIDATYRTHPFRILVGHSLAGLFAVESLTRSPELFQATFALSPSIYWNQFEWLKKAPELLEAHDALKHFLFISVEKKNEEQTAYLDQFKHSVSVKAPDGFAYEYRCFPDENHGSVAFPGLYANLKQLFQGWGFPGEAWEAGPDKVRHHFESLSKRFGFAVPIEEEFLIDHALHGLRSHEAPDEAISLLQFCLSLYPSSADAYEGLGEAYEAKGENDKAIASYRKALELNPDSKKARAKITDLREYF
jgi:predicted alpha/beta superfamily hydrolase